MSATAAVRPFKRLEGLGQALRVLLAVGVLLDVVFIVVTFLEVRILERFRRGEASLQEASDAIDRSGSVGLVVLVAYVSTVVVWLVWQHRGQSNLHSLAIPWLRFSPGWAVGWWLVPVANLWKPFETVRELWKASGGDEAWWKSATWPVIGWWWAGYVVFNIVDSVTARFWGSSSATVDSYIVGDWISIAGDLGSMLTALLAISIVGAVTDRQAELERVVAERTSVPARPDLTDDRSP